MENIILKQIESAQFLCVIMNTVKDINRKDQLHQIFGYVSISKDEAEGPPT